MKTTRLKNRVFLMFCLMALVTFNGFAQNDSIPETEKIKKKTKKATVLKC